MNAEQRAAWLRVFIAAVVACFVIGLTLTAVFLVGEWLEDQIGPMWAGLVMAGLVVSAIVATAWTFVGSDGDS